MGQKPPVLKFLEDQISKVETLEVIKDELMTLVTEAWETKPVEYKHQVMRKVSNNFDRYEYFKILRIDPIQHTQALKDLGPLLRLQVLFAMCDDQSLDVQSSLYSWGCEVFRNLKLVGDLTMLDDLYLGDHGKEMYSKLPLIALEEKAPW